MICLFLVVENWEKGVVIFFIIICSKRGIFVYLIIIRKKEEISNSICSNSCFNVYVKE